MKEKYASDQQVRKDVREFQKTQKKEAEKEEIRREMEATKERDAVCNEVVL